VGDRVRVTKYGTKLDTEGIVSDPDWCGRIKIKTIEGEGRCEGKREGKREGTPHLCLPMYSTHLSPDVLHTFVSRCTPHLCLTMYSTPLSHDVLHTFVSRCTPHLCLTTLLSKARTGMLLVPPGHICRLNCCGGSGLQSVGIRWLMAWCRGELQCRAVVMLTAAAAAVAVPQRVVTQYQGLAARLVAVLEDQSRHLRSVCLGRRTKVLRWCA
jgi:hypothetical protein